MRIARGYWMKAAQLISAGDLAAARLGFQKATIHATRAGAEADRLIARGFELLVDLLENPEDTQVQIALDEVKSEFQPLEHGQMYIEQIETAYRVYKAA